MSDVPTRLTSSMSMVELAKYDVYFNGKKQTQCTVADTMGQYIERYKTAAGALVRRNGQLVTERLHGQVRIVRRGAKLI